MQKIEPISNDFMIRALDEEKFKHLFNLSEHELESLGVRRVKVDQSPGYPCRVSLADANVGDEVILFTYEHLSGNTPYRASGPVYVAKGALNPKLQVNEIPKMLMHRLLSVTAVPFKFS